MHTLWSGSGSGFGGSAAGSGSIVAMYDVSSVHTEQAGTVGVAAVAIIGVTIALIAIVMLQWHMGQPTEPPGVTDALIEIVDTAEGEV